MTEISREQIESILSTRKSEPIVTENRWEAPKEVAQDPTAGFPQAAAWENPHLKRLDTCKSGRPKAVVAEELRKEQAKLNELHVLVTLHREKRMKSEARFENWKIQWQANHRGEPLDLEDYPHKVVELDRELVQKHHRQHYIVNALENELEGTEER